MARDSSGSSEQSKPLLVFALPKVGNTTVVRALVRAGLEPYRAHFLSDGYFFRALGHLQLAGDEARVQELIEWNESFRKKVAAGFEGRGCNIVSLVRDPLARTVSYFFDTTSMKGTDIRRRWEDGSLDVDDIVRRFMGHDDHFAPLEWLDSEMNAVFGIDTFAEPFPREAGYRIFRKDNISLLLLRLEDLTRCASGAFREFLGIDTFDPRPENVRGDSETAALYRVFLDRLRLPREHVDRMYDSKLALHFYSEQELESFRARWRIVE
jgi:hypothetical protein